MSIDEKMQRWGRKFLGAPDDVAVQFYDETVQGAGGCETCGYGADETYRLNVYAAGYGSKDYEGRILDLISEIDAES